MDFRRRRRAVHRAEATGRNHTRRWLLSLSAAGLLLSPAAVSALPAQADTVGPPTLTVSGHTISWDRVDGKARYVLKTILNPATTRNATYKTVRCCSVTPAAVPGQAVSYRLRVAVGGARWSKVVSITFTTAPPTVVIGMNDCLGWAGGTQAGLLTSHHIGYCRAGYEEHGGAVSETPAKLIANGLKVATVLIGNTDDSVSLSQVTIGDGTGAPDPIRNWLAYAVAQVDDATSNAGADVPLEVGNEMYLKGGPGAVADPVKYGQMFAGLAAARPNANLLFSSSGDYQRADGSWSQQASRGAWLGDALARVPSLASRVGGFVNHPYGDLKPQPKNSGNSWGPGALPAQHDYAASLGYQHADSWYLTEYGSSYPTAGDGDSQAADARTAYSYFESLPYVKAILWFQFRDYDGMGPPHSGAFNDDNSPRPVVSTLQDFAAAQGQ